MQTLVDVDNLCDSRGKGEEDQYKEKQQQELYSTLSMGLGSSACVCGYLETRDGSLL